MGFRSPRYFHFELIKMISNSSHPVVLNNTIIELGNAGFVSSEKMIEMDCTALEADSKLFNTMIAKEMVMSVMKAASNRGPSDRAHVNGCTTNTSDDNLKTCNDWTDTKSKLTQSPLTSKGRRMLLKMIQTDAASTSVDSHSCGNTTACSEMEATACGEKVSDKSLNAKVILTGLNFTDDETNRDVDIWNTDFWNTDLDDIIGLTSSTETGSGSEAVSSTTGDARQGNHGTPSSLEAFLQSMQTVETVDSDDDDCSEVSDLTGLTGSFPDYFPSTGRRGLTQRIPSTKELIVDSLPGGRKAVRSIMKLWNAKRAQTDMTVSFGTVEIREYERILSDNPCCSAGPAVGIGWRYEPMKSLTINDWEDTRGPRRISPQLVLDRRRRESMLRAIGYTEKELVAAIRTANRTKTQRRQTVNNLGAQKMEETVEKVKRGIKKLMFSIEKAENAL